MADVREADHGFADEGDGFGIVQRGEGDGVFKVGEDLRGDPSVVAEPGSGMDDAVADGVDGRHAGSGRGIEDGVDGPCRALGRNGVRRLVGCRSQQT